MAQVRRIVLVSGSIHLVFTLDALPPDDGERQRICTIAKGNPRATKVIDCVIPKGSVEVSVVLEEYLWRYPDRLKGMCLKVLTRLQNESGYITEVPTEADLPELPLAE